MTEPEDGRAPIERVGFSYLPQFMSVAEAEELIAYFGLLHPLWEERYRGEKSGRRAAESGRLTRPVYWLGAWQFACLGYYSEPDHRENRCVVGEEFPPVMKTVLERIRPHLARHESKSHLPQAPENDGLLVSVPNTCLINYYGRTVGQGPPRDFARLRMHRDAEPGPVVMFCFGQAGLLEFLDPNQKSEVELGLWTRHRSVTILSGPEYKDRLYHRVSQVRMGEKPQMKTQLRDFELRRVSVSFRHVPDSLIREFSELPASSREMVRDYVASLAKNSAHFFQQLNSEGGQDEP